MLTKLTSVVFLGSDASVKLGDFGLSKIMQSHDFASTYVGTPFYMSPEICQAENYSLHSDIWALGCIMYELCAREPPFNAKTHFELIQRIRLGKFTPLSHSYSTELKESIAKCLRTNPMTRPDTAQLLNIPMVKLKRKELEVVKLGRQLKSKESEIEKNVRIEWELRARLEIDKQVQQTRDELRRQFESEVARRVAEELRNRALSQQPKHQTEPCDQRDHLGRSTTPNQEDMPGDHRETTHHQSQSTTGETDDFPSSTDLSELSLESPTLEKTQQKPSHRAPFARAQTMFDGSPNDVNMADPSPAPISSLNLSPRREQHQPLPRTRNIFRAATSNSPVGSDADEDDEDDTDEVPALPSPTKARHLGGDPFKQLGTASRRPGLVRQKTAPQNKVNSAPLFGGGSRLTKDNSQPNLTGGPLLSKPANASTSPKRRMSKLPSATTSGGVESTSPPRKPLAQTSPQRRPPSRKNDTAEMRHTAALNNHVQGRTLIELAQARTAAPGISTQDFAEASPHDGKDTGVSGKEEEPHDVMIWDPERDEMPSPFLARKGRGVLSGHTGGPGLKHLR